MMHPQDLFSNLFSSEISYHPEFEQITQLWLSLDSDKSNVVAYSYQIWLKDKIYLCAWSNFEGPLECNTRRISSCQIEPSE